MDFSQFYALFQHSFKINWWILLIAIFLIFINWGIETIKWQFLIKHIEQLSFIKAFSAITAGVAVSSFTPNRVGEFAGRMFFLRNKLDSRVITLTIIGSMSQLMITLLIGLPGFLVYLSYNSISGLITPKWIQAFMMVLPFLYLIVFWNLPFIFRKIKEKFSNNKIVIYISDGTLFLTNSGLRHISYLSFYRYLTFVVQFVLIFLFFEVHMIWWQYLVFIPAIFFVQSVIPTFVLTEIGVRVSAALAILSFTHMPDINIIAASSLLWVLNLMVPSIIGVFALLFTKINNIA